MPSEFTREDTMSASDQKKPLPCPFCGCERIGVHRRAHARTTGYVACCLQCNVSQTGVAYGSVPAAIAAWNTRAGDKRAREAVPAGKLTRAEIDRVAHYAIESAILAPADWEAAGLYDFAHAVSGGIPVVDDLCTLVVRLVRALRKAAPDAALPDQAMDYLKRHGLSPSPLRDAAPTPGEKT